MMLVLGLLAPTVIPALAAPPRQQGTFDPINAQRATVYVMQVYNNPLGQPVIACVGSGTLVSADGLILTNAHNATSSDTCKTERLVIGLTVRLGEAPIATYIAERVASNVGWDLAVLQVISTLDGRPINRDTLTLPFVEIDTADSTRLDDTINVVGYVLSDEKASGAAQVVRGNISGYTAEARVGDQAWIKTNAVIPGGMSGGGAYDIHGKLIGIPTIEPARSGGATLNCRRVQDTNGDRRVDNQDNCIPISGFINALRPVRLARGLVLAARLGVTPAEQMATQSDESLTAPPTFSRLFFAPGVNQAGMPTSVVTGLPAGTTRLYLFFDYDNMADGMLYELRTTLDGVPNATFSLAPATWSGGRQGLWYIGSTAQAWPNGTYEFTLFIEGVRVASAQITIGGPAKQIPTLSDILFGILGSNNELVSTGNVLPVGNTINAEFICNNMIPNMLWRQVWYYEGLKVSESAGEWKEGINGKVQVSASAPPDKPLQPGRYRLELYLGDQMAATSDFVMAGALDNLRTTIFANLNFASDVKDNRPAGVIGTTFSNPIQQLYATFDWRELAPNTPWTWRWSVDGNPLFEVTQPWLSAPTGSTNWLRLDSRGHLPDGSYKLELLLGGLVIANATAKVGLGQLPVTTFGVSEGVQLQGRIVDAETGKGIPGVMVIVLKTDYAVRDFTWQMSEVYDLSLSDSQGQFSLARLLARTDKNTYSVIVLARGYLPMSTDGLRVDEKTVSPVILNIEMNRD
ncbi:MAG: trypsin-like peptidase domain-containing protein [Anaerolineae bacterium]|nr:trypsin-like peptidase domain-containing protein [Anaerolineae bacterium]